MGPVKITRSYYGYYKYQLIPQKRCKTCRRQYEKDTERCPQCGRLTQTVFGQSQPKYHDFPSPYAESGFHLALDTIAAWLMAPAAMEEKLYRGVAMQVARREERGAGVPAATAGR